MDNPKDKNINIASAPPQGKKASAGPQITLTSLARQQLRLILENDFTLYANKTSHELAENTGPYLRISITGKECDGFTYGIGFAELQPNDVVVSLNLGDEQLESNQVIKIVMDPFCAHFLTSATIDYAQDFAHNSEGFIITNHNQKTYAGKFWRGSPEKAPKLG